MYATRQAVGYRAFDQAHVLSDDSRKQRDKHQTD